MREVLQSWESWTFDRILMWLGHIIVWYLREAIPNFYHDLPFTRKHVLCWNLLCHDKDKSQKSESENYSILFDQYISLWQLHFQEINHARSQKTWFYILTENIGSLRKVFQNFAKSSNLTAVWKREGQFTGRSCREKKLTSYNLASEIKIRKAQNITKKGVTSFSWCHIDHEV